MEYLFSTNERLTILKTVIFKSETISVNNIAHQLKLSKGLVSKYFDMLVKEGIARKSNGKVVINDTSLTKGLKILLNIYSIDTKLFKKYPFIKSVGLYGSCAKGENTEDSDVDIWVRVEEASEAGMASLTSQVSKAIKNAKLLFLTDKKIEKIKEEDTLFYHSLAFGSIIIYGDKDGIQL
jgi:predicted nucleotidyltransferase